MNTALSDLSRELIQSIEAKDLAKCLALFDEDAEFLDPHYPKVHMQGKDEIYAGIKWGLEGVKSFRFTSMNYFENEAGDAVSIEMVAELVLKNGKEINYQQVFIMCVNNGKISRLQAYETYGPHGILKIILNMTRLKNRLLRRL